MRLMLLCAAMLAAGPVLAEEGDGTAVCLDRAKMVERLTGRFGEQQLAMGLTDAGIAEIYASAETGTFTIVISLPDGSSCMLAAGEMWEPVAPQPKGDPL